MRRARAVWLLLLLALILSSCAGRDFTRPAPDTLVLGKTTYVEINARFGSPFSQSTLVRNEKTIGQASYAYASTGGQAIASGVTPGRGIDFFFVDQVLVGHEFVSSFAADNTDFDETRAASIKKGETTRAEIERLFGPPHGLHVYPLIAGRDDTALVWSFVQVRAAGFSVKVYQKKLVVSMSPAGIVTDVQLTVSGER